ncbi:phosphatase PAP2 family protein [Thermoanaerobacter sp. A7A]|uniref:phosphatase PAP2 family protein n=1 Tax=Thermoanaerobacter sp. A7A TaxID=1350366 RepID=UPI00041682A0|nr:phosphatase PAP2 family protein [Thermoanaerobacter sp. A7A]
MQADILKAIQTITNPLLDYFFIAITMLGSAGFYFIFIPLFYWCVDKRFGLKLGLILISSIYVNTILKEITKINRPIGYPGIRSVFTQSAGGYSFPSGHAQGSTTVWGTLMVHYQKKWLWYVGIAIVLLVSFSRMYLGVHWPIDIIGGILIAVLIIILSELIDSIVKENTFKMTLNIKILLSILIPGLFIIIFPHKDIYEYMGLISGTLIGYFIDKEEFDFTVHTVLPKQILKFIIGVIVFFALKESLKFVLPSGDIFNAIRYAICGLWLSLGAPYVFNLFKLNDKLIKA